MRYYDGGATIGQLLVEAERWVHYYNERRPHRRLNYQAPNAYAEERGLGKAPHNYRVYVLKEMGGGQDVHVWTPASSLPESHK